MSAPAKTAPLNAARVAARMAQIAPFHVMDILARGRELEAAGRDVIHLEVGEPDFPTPEPILAAGARALQQGRLPYTESLGIPALRAAIAHFYRERFGIELDPARVIVTAGASGALLLTMGVLIDPGAQVLLTDPGYPCNRQFVRVMEGEPVGVPVEAASHYQLTAALIERAWTERVAAVLLASPANPTGTSVPVQEMSAIHALVQRRGATLIVDEIYQGLTYDSAPTTALALADDIFIINSFSKYFQMTGWRLGWIVAPRAYVREIEKLAQNLFINPSTPAQYAALAAFEPRTLAIAEQRRREFQARRDYLLPALRELGFSIPVTPEGAFYIYADCSRFTADSYQFARQLLEDAGVAVAVGKDFGSHKAAQHLRFSYCVAQARLIEAVARLKSFVA